MDGSLSGSSVHGILQAKNTGVSSYSLLQGIFLTQRSNPYLLMSPALAGTFVTIFGTWEAWGLF